MKIIAHTDLDNIIFRYKEGTKNNIESYIVIGYRFLSMKFEYTGLRKNLFENCIFEGVVFETVYFDDSEFRDCIFKNCTFDSIDFGLSHVTFENVVFYNSDFSKTDSLHCTYINSSFDSCNFFYFDISTNKLESCRFVSCDLKGLIYSPDTFGNGNVIVKD